MTEAEWLASRDVQAMYIFLRDATTLFKTRWQGYRAVPRFAFSERKSRLFAVACCRRILHLMPTAEARQCVRAAECFADGLIDDTALSAAVEASTRSCEQDWRRRRGRHTLARPEVARAAINAVGRVHRQEGARAAVTAAAAEALARAALFQAADDYSLEKFQLLQNAEQARQADMLRDVVGNPWRSPSVDPAWLAWNDRCAERLARGIYDEHRYARLPVLHDALLDAGCNDEAILAHCRTPDGHVRGCWAIDLLLGKE
jgi:hypothetical protein